MYMDDLDLNDSEWWEDRVYGNFKIWHVVFLTLSSFLSLTTLLCCCIKIRVPRTKQQIEADYQRKILTRKFRQELQKIQNSQMDALDLKAALDLIQAEFIAENESKKEEINQRNDSIVSSISSQMQLMADEFLAKHAKKQEIGESSSGLNRGRFSGKTSNAFNFPRNETHEMDVMA